MTPRASTRRLVALLSLSAVWVLLSCAPALAHARLVQAEPGEGATLTESPDQVELRFSEPVDAEFSPLEVRDSAGNRVDEDDARIDPEDARVLLAGLEQLPDGTYEVQWRVTSIDGHVVEGRYEFALTGAAGDQATEDAREAQGQGAGERTGHAGRTEQEPAMRDSAQESSTPIMAYSILSIGVLAGIAAGAYLLSRLVRRPRT